MARKFFNHPGHYDNHPNQKEQDLKASAGLLANVPRIEGSAYSTMFEIAKYAERHGRGLAEIEEAIEGLIQEGYAVRKEARFVRLTKKGRGLIGLP